MRLRYLLFAGTIFYGAVCPVLAQTQPVSPPIPVSVPIHDNLSDKDTYPAAFFTQYAPRTASDIINQVPGFQIAEGSGKRGLGQGGANVLINGARLTGKANARDQLDRIASANVVRVEILDGASLDIPGLSGQVANIITTSSGMTGIWRYEPEFRKYHEPNFTNGEISVSGERGNLNYSVLLRSDGRHGGDAGSEDIFDTDRVLLTGNTLAMRDYSNEYTLSTDLSWSPKESHTGNLSVEYIEGVKDDRQITQRTNQPSGETADLEIIYEDEDEITARIGADYAFPIGLGKLKVIGEHRVEASDTAQTGTTFVTSAGIGELSERNDLREEEEGETIGRAEYSWATQAGHDWQISAEGAFNFLDVVSNRVGETSRVEEKRAELTATHSRSLSEAWDIQASIGAEYSQISQETSGLDPQEFVRPKGFLSATYHVDPSLDIRGKITRDVGQLNFNDFISSNDPSTGIVTLGNSALVPEQSWMGEIEFDKDFGNGITLIAGIYGALVTDVVDEIRIGDGSAVGNIDEANFYGLEVVSTLKGDYWGFKGTQLDLTFRAGDSNVDDPIEGFNRSLSGHEVHYFEAEFRHDIDQTDWAYGIAVDERLREDTYRPSRIDGQVTESIRGRMYIEHKDILGAKAQLRLINPFDSVSVEDTQNYTDFRDIGVLETLEHRELKGGRFLQVNMSGTF